MMLQCVMNLSPESPHIPKNAHGGISPAFLNTIFGRRSASVPPLSSERQQRSQSRSSSPTMMPERHCIRFWIKICCECDTTDPLKPTKDALLSPAAAWVPPFFSDLVGQTRRPPPMTRAVSYSHATRTPSVASIPGTRTTARSPMTGEALLHQDLVSGRKRSSSQRSMRLAAHNGEHLNSRYISLQVSDGRCLGTLVEALQSSQAPGLLSPRSVIGELDIDDRDEAIQEAMRVREKAAGCQPSSTGNSKGTANSSDITMRGLNLRLSGSYGGSRIPSPGQGDSDEEEEKSPLIKTSVLNNEVDMEERTSRSREKTGFSHIVKSRAEHPDIQITPVNAFYYERAHSASPARFTRALPLMH